MAKLRVALVTPLTGPLALYGRASAAALTLWANRAAQLPAGFTGVDLDIQDSGDQRDQMQIALHRVLDRQPDVLFGPYGSGPMLAVARSCARLIWNHGGASSRLARPAFPQVMNVLSPATTYFASVLQAIHAADATVSSVSLLHSTTGFGRDVATGAQSVAERLQMTLHTIPFTPSHVLEAVGNVPDGDVLLVAGNFADERAVAPPLRARDWRFSAFVGAGVDEVLIPADTLREGLLGPAQWMARTALEPDEGPDVAWFEAQYREATGSEPSYPAAQAFAAGVLYARCLREAGEIRDKAIQIVAQKLRCQTLFGAFQLDPDSGLQIGHQVVIVQWQRGERRVVWPPEQAERPLMFAPSH
jgi:ABC-type branched-subunit amino acid transport system substrate-binding protein